MERSLLEALGARIPPRIADFAELPLVDERRGQERIEGLVNRYAEAYGLELVLYGGIAAAPGFWGLKRIREPTTDLDFACTEAGLAAVLMREPLFYHEGFDMLFTVTDNIPVAFAYGHIHDWPVDEGFFSEARILCPYGLPVLCASLGHSVMLKMRRTVELLAGGRRPYGKDALDILNMLAAQVCRSAEGLEVGRLCSLVKTGTGASRDLLLEAFDFVLAYSQHLLARELRALEPALKSMREELSRPLALHLG